MGQQCGTVERHAASAAHHSHAVLACRMDGNAVLERYNKYGGGLYPVAWYDLQQFWAGKLPEGALQIGATFERFEQGADGVDVHFRVRACLPTNACLQIIRACMPLQPHMHARNILAGVSCRWCI